jgi:hypothetical protein
VLVLLKVNYTEIIKLFIMRMLLMYIFVVKIKLLKTYIYIYISTKKVTKVLGNCTEIVELLIYDSPINIYSC